jgi:hypothetical protein
MEFIGPLEGYVEVIGGCREHPETAAQIYYMAPGFFSAKLSAFARTYALGFEGWPAARELA